MSGTKILDFTSKRKEVVEQKRRSFERVLFQNFLGVYSVIDVSGVIHPISLVDISQEGCLIQIPWNFKKDAKFPQDYEVTLRLYFTKQSYIPAVVKVKHGTEYVDENGHTYMRYGCEFDQSVGSFEALKSFIDFVYKFAEHSTIDKGDIKVFYL
mgnify:FL=1